MPVPAGVILDAAPPPPPGVVLDPPADLTQNPQGEGTYKMVGPQGQQVQVPFGDPGMSAGERSAALNQWLRRRQQMRLPAAASPIQLPPTQQ